MARRFQRDKGWTCTFDPFEGRLNGRKVGCRFSLAVVVPVPLYAVEKLARLFFPLSPSVFFSFLFCSPVQWPKASEGLLVSIERWAKAGVAGGRGETEEDVEARGGLRLHRAFPFPRYPSIPQRTSFVTQSKLSLAS